MSSAEIVRRPAEYDEKPPVSAPLILNNGLEESANLLRPNDAASSAVSRLFDRDNPFTIDAAQSPEAKTGPSGTTADGGDEPDDVGSKPPRKPGAETPDADTPLEQKPEKKDAPGVIGEIRTFGRGGNAKADSEYFRKVLADAGINPDKISTTIGTYEPIYESAKEHPFQVAEVINGKENGFIRGADVKTFSPRETTQSMELAEYRLRKDPVADFVTEYSIAAMKDMSKFITDQLINKDDPKILNISQGFTLMDSHRAMLNQMKQNPDRHAAIIRGLLGEEKGNQWIKEQNDRRTAEAEAKKTGKLARGWKDSELDREFEKALYEKVASTLDGNTQFESALKEYQEVTKQAAEKGKFIVVAAGNEGMTAKQERLNIPEGKLYNWYAMSDHVISVGGYDSNNTPFDRTDDTLWPATSVGTERFHPTVLAQGVGVPTKYGRGETQGTSMATPAVTACIALMLEQNPKLKFDQVKAILEKSSTPLNGVAAVKQGKGILNIANAVIAAKGCDEALCLNPGFENRN